MSLDTIIKAVTSGFSQFNFKDIVDILVIAILIYQLIRFTRETRAYQVLKGIGTIFVLAVVVQLFGFTMISWFLDAIISTGVLVLVILFQPELRRGLEQLGRGKLLERTSFFESTLNTQKIITELLTAINNLSRRRVGALIVFERKIGLKDIILTGTPLESIVSCALIENIFEPNTPLHDGAIIIRYDVIVAAGCFLPLSDDINLERELGTRHRAALGISSVSDSGTIVISEETGVVSLAREGKLIRYMDSKAIRDFLESIYLSDKNDKDKSFLGFFRRRNK